MEEGLCRIGVETAIGLCNLEPLADAEGEVGVEGIEESKIT